MEVIEELSALQNIGPSVVTVGVFDGVHIGHQSIMQVVTQDARLNHARAVAITFDRNPQEYVHPSDYTPCITTLRQKLELLAEQGIELTLVLPLARHILEMPAEQFVTEILHRRLKATRVVIGADFAFGKGRRGNAELLREMGRELDFHVDVVHPVVVGETIVSSTIIRQMIAAGDIDLANEMLGHPFAVDGLVVEGERIGRTIGFPTANVKPAEGQVIPASGVYSVSVELSGVRQLGVANIGTRPTVGGESLTVEVHLIGFSGELYGQELVVKFHHRLRNEERFPSLEHLRLQISSDIEQALQLDARDGN